jgi:hypothetical protein
MAMIRKQSTSGSPLLQSLTAIHLQIAEGQLCNAKHTGVVLRRKLQNFVVFILGSEALGAVDILMT